MGEKLSDMTLPEQLRTLSGRKYVEHAYRPLVMQRAADEIERLSAENRMLVAVLDNIICTATLGGTAAELADIAIQRIHGAPASSRQEFVCEDAPVKRLKLHKELDDE